MTTFMPPRSRTAYLFALLLLLLLPAVVPAQTPWSTPDAGNNINNTNTGNVGVGTAAPTGKLDVKGSTSDPSAPAVTVRNSSDTNLFFVRNDGNVGVGTTNPLAFFHVARGSATTGVAAFFHKDTSSSGVTLGTMNSRGFLSSVNANLTAATDLLINPFGGNVGIGTTTPGSTLFVVTPGGTRSGLTIMGDGNAWVYTDLVMRPATTSSISTGMPYSFDWSVRKDNAYGGDASGPSLVMEVARQGGGVYAPFVINPNGNVILAGALNATNGNVGVGTTTPAYKLDISGQVRSSGGFVFPNGTVQTTAATITGVTAGTGLTGGGSSGSVTLNVSAGTGITAGAGGVSVNYGSTTGTAVQGNTTLSVTAGDGLSGGGTSTLGAGGTLTLTNNDKGSSQSIFKNVANAAGTTQFAAGSNNDTLKFEGTGGTSVSFDSAAKKVTINGARPVSYGSTAGTAVQGNTTLTLTAGAGMSGGGTSTLGSGGTLTLTNSDRGSSQNIFKNVANAAGVTQFTAGSNNDSISFEGTGGTSVSFNAAARKVTINGAGASGWTDAGASLSTTSASAKVGIGTTAPSKKLEVVGGVKVSKEADGTGGDLTVEGAITGGTVSATYQDVAEWVPSVQKLQAGTVVVLDGARTNHVLASTSAYDTKVAGVVSAEPGVILGVAGEDKVKVATTGRVRVKVDASRGAVKVGDLLVTSGVEGVAMKSVPVDLGGTQIHRPGTIIGKALEPLEQGVGEILVLLSLQ